MKASRRTWALPVMMLAGLFGGLYFSMIGVSLEDFESNTIMPRVIGGAIVGVALAAYPLYYLPIAHRRRLATLAAQRGWRFSKAPNPPVLPARGFPFSVGGSQKTLDVARAEIDGREVAIMFYRVVTSSGRSSTTFEFTIIAAHVEANLPVTLIAPERGLARVAAVLGLQDIDVESAAFNRQWRVRAEETRGAVAVLEPRTMERLMEPDARGFMISWDANAVLLTQSGIRRNWSGIDSDLALVVKLASMVPAYYKRERPEMIGQEWR